MTIQLTIIARNCDSDQIIRDYLQLGSCLASSLRSRVSIRTCCIPLAPACEGASGPNLRTILVNGEDVGPLALHELVDYLHFMELGLLSA